VSAGLVRPLPTPAVADTSRARAAAQNSLSAERLIKQSDGGSVDNCSRDRRRRLRQTDRQTDRRLGE